MPRIHPTAIVDPAAQLDEGVVIGAYSVVGPDVRIGAGTEIGPHCVIDGCTTIGRDNRFYRFCSIGGMPQDKKYGGEPTRLVIGDRNTVREFVTFNTGTVQDGGVTTVGNDNWIMAYVHVAHDCHIGNNVILANGVQLGGQLHALDGGTGQQQLLASLHVRSAPLHEPSPRRLSASATEASMSRSRWSSASVSSKAMGEWDACRRTMNSMTSPTNR